MISIEALLLLLLLFPMQLQQQMSAQVLAKTIRDCHLEISSPSIHLMSCLPQIERRLRHWMQIEQSGAEADE